MILSADIGDSVQRFSDQFFEWLPRLIGAIVILVIFYLIAKAVRKLIENALPRTGIDPISLELNPKVGVRSVVLPLGPEVIAVSGWRKLCWFGSSRLAHSENPLQLTSPA